MIRCNATHDDLGVSEFYQTASHSVASHQVSMIEFIHCKIAIINFNLVPHPRMTSKEKLINKLEG